MRILTLLVGMIAVTGASAGELDSRLAESDALTGQIVYRVQFGGAAGVPATRSFSLQIANEGQRLAGLAPIRADYLPDSGRFLVNGLDIERTFAMRQSEEGGIAGAMGGWLPLVIVLGAASLIIVDGQDQTGGSGSGSSGG